jgi:colanic acid biosynthesis protein WcaH
MWISPEKLEVIVRYSALVSIDLIVEVKEKILLGLRVNQPALGYWFVPGSRVAKKESLPEAFRSITEMELGSKFDIKDAEFLGVYDHFYEDNFLRNKDFETRYIVLAFKIKLLEALPNLPGDQHSEYRYWGVEELLQAKDVHNNTKAYFDERYISPGLMVIR